MCDVLLPPGVNPTAVKIYIYIYHIIPLLPLWTLGGLLWGDLHLYPLNKIPGYTTVTPYLIYATLDIPPQTAVNKLWHYIGILLYTNS
jgi:hypothetical protein